jgi:hypothetical protein|tara:strand:+ start:861 stop:1685 length:825 start_codon:yes stop_codon:yes gene_type:complete
MAGWSEQTWSLGTWGLLGDINVSVTGQSLTSSLGSESFKIDASFTVSGIALSSTLSTPSVDITGKVFPTGIAMTSVLANADAGPDAMLTTNHATMSLGTIDAFNQTGWGRQGWNENAWGVEGQYANVDVTGIAMTAAGGSVSMAGEVVVTLNTLNANVTLGQADPAPDANLLSQLMTGNLGTLGMQGDVSPSLTGITMSAALGNETIELNTPVDLTGIAMSASVTTPVIVIDADVSTTGLALTIAQGSGSALIWNEVNTGSAPITPPGWQEVAA